MTGVSPARPFWAASLLVVILAAGATGAAAAQDQNTMVDFGSARWSVTAGKVVEFLGRTAFMGAAELKDVEFENGVIDYDFAVSTDRARSYPGITFRVRPGGNWERFYIRPHRSALYDDVLQYVAAFNGVDSWQFYNGPGASASAVVPVNQWVHVRVEVSGSQARVFVGDAPEPALVIPALKHGRSKGWLGVMGPADGTTYFSNFSYRLDNSIVFGPPPPVDEVPGVIRDWQLSKAFPADAIDLETVPDQQSLGDLGWVTVSAEASGLVDVSRVHPRATPADAVFARTTITADQDGLRTFDLGYSDVVTVFLNGYPVFSANSQYQGRDSSFLGVVGWFDTVFLPLRKGTNELTLAVAEVSGGWGFMLRDANVVFAAPGVSKVWETPPSFLVPESAAYDAKRDRLYVSNFDQRNPSRGAGKQAIAKLALDGRILDPTWITGVNNPTGLVVVGDKLYAVERQAIAEIDIVKASVIARYPVPTPGVPNDIAAAPDGSLYLSDSRRGIIHRLANGVVEPWLQDAAVSRPNGLIVDGSKLIVANNFDNCLKAIDLATKSITTIATLGPGIGDGLAVIGQGDYLVSHNEGRLFRVTADGHVAKILDTTNKGWLIADFALAKGMIVFPTFSNNRVMAYRIPGVK